jgi:eukaryotic-like serine/threonine-protein kinase
MVDPKRIEAFGSKYELLDHIARGGMSDVYAARVTGIEGFEKTVAIKRVRPDLAIDRDMVEMFLKEARLAGMLHHPNIAQVYDLGIVDGSYFLAMEYVRGVDVRWMLQSAAERHREIPLEVVLAVGLGVLSGLHYLHEQADVVHRDISPSNVMVGVDGSVKIIDFGIALPHSAHGGGAREFHGGKPSYMSPEQVMGWPLDRRTDIFSAGILLWELSVLDKLYRGRDESEVRKRIIDEDVMPPSVMRADVPAELDRIIMRALARHPNSRYPTADEMREELEYFAHRFRIDFSTSTVALYLNAVLGVTVPM